MLVCSSFLIFSCSKVIDVVIPPSDPQLVVEGVIKNGQPPLVLLSESQAYFSPIAGSLDDYYISGASVTVSIEGEVFQLVETPSSSLSSEHLEYLSNLFKQPSIYIMFAQIPVYTLYSEPLLLGTYNTIYDLHVVYEDYEANASTTLNPAIQLNSTEFNITEGATQDSLGIINMSYTDPDTLGNCYRISSRRVNTFPDWHILAGEVKDPYYIYPLGSSWDDLFLNGGEYDFTYVRYPNEQDHIDSLETGLWKLGDTVLIKLETIDANAYETLLSFETAISAQTNPFSPPTNIISHVEGALGWWIASAESIDTVYCTP
jgi:hypothetical protein